ncbi:small GTPase LIP1-like [Wolffia australiana]
MFWRKKEKDSPDQTGGSPCGHVRVLVVGDAGVGKTSLIHLIVKGSATTRPPQTVGCAVGVKHITYGRSNSSSNSIKNDSEREFFVELWDIAGHERYKKCRSIFYSQINGVIFVHDLSQRRTKGNLHKWALEIAEGGTFSAPLSSGGPGGLPVPFLVISNKTDIAAPAAGRGSSGNLVDAARFWVERQGLLPPTEEIPLSDSFPGGTPLISAAKEGRFDKEAIVKFFRLLIRRRYFPEEQPGLSPWSLSQAASSILLSSEISSADDQSLRFKRLGEEDYRHNGLAPLPAQRNLTPPTTMYPQQPVATPDEGYGFQRYAGHRAAETGGTGRIKRADINV